jgi:hypothetical protein
VVLGREAEIVDLPGGAPAPEDAGCTVVVAPLDVYEEPPPARGRAVLVGSRADLGQRGLLELYAARLRPAAALALDLRRAPRWVLARAVAACASELQQAPDAGDLVPGVIAPAVKSPAPGP